MFGPNADIPHALLLDVLSCLDMRSRLRLLNSCQRAHNWSPFASYSVGTVTDRLFHHRSASWRVEGLIAAIERAIHSKHNQHNPDCAAHAIALSSVPIGARFMPSLVRALGGRPELPKNLKSVCLRNCGVTDAIVPALLLHLSGTLRSAHLVCDTGEGGDAALREVSSTTTLEVLGLRNNMIGTTGANALFQALKENATLTMLDFSENNVDAGATEIGECIRVNRALVSVNLLKNNIGDYAATVVAAATQNGSIKTLCGTEEGSLDVHLCDQQLDEADAILLSFDLEFNTALRNAYLARNNNIGVGGVMAVCNALKKNNTLETLVLRRVVNGWDYDNVVVTGIGIACAQAIANMLWVNRSLKSVDCSENGIGSQGTAAVSEALKSNRTLEDLKLVFNDIDTVGAQSLANMLRVNESLKSADCSFNSIADTGATALSEALQTNTTLETLALRGNRVGASGAQSLARMFQVNRALTSVNLLNNDLGGGAAAVVAAAKQNSNIRTLCGIEEGATDVDLADHCHADADLWCGNSEPLRASDAPLLIFDLENNRALTSINLLKNDLGGGVAAVVAAAKQNGNIKTLCGIKDGQNAVDLRGSRCDALKPSDVVLLCFDLECNRALKRVDLSSNKICGVSRGGGWTHDPDAEWRYAHTDGLCRNHRPPGVQFEGGDLTGIQALAGVLEINRTLTSVNLLRNDLGDSAASIVTAAKKQGVIKTLCGIKEGETRVNFAYNSLYNDRLQVSDAVLLTFDLETNRALKRANLGYNDFGDKGTAALSETLKTNNTLEELILLQNEIGVAGAQSLANMLRLNSTLKSLNLASNDIGLPDGWTIRRTYDLYGRPTLEYKHTDGRTQTVFPQGTRSAVIALAESLTVNKALTSVNLLNNDLGEGAAAIVAAAKRHGKIKTLCGVETMGTKSSALKLKTSDVVLLSFDVEFNGALAEIDVSGSAIFDDAGKRATAGALLRRDIRKMIDVVRREWQFTARASCLSLNGERNGERLTLADTKLVAGAIKFNKSLTILNLCNNEIGVGGANAIAGTISQSALRSLTVNATLNLEKLQTSASVDLGNKGLRVEEAIVVAKCMEINSALTSVNLLQNDLGEGAAAVVAAAKQHGDIHTLCGIKDGQTKADFSECWRVKRLQAPDAVLLRFDLEFNRSLTSVNLLKNNLGSGAAALVAAAKRQGKIKTLCGIEDGESEVDFSYRYDGDWLKAPDAALLGLDLARNGALTSVDFRYNDIGKEGADFLSETLKTNNTLEELKLIGNKIGVAGARALAGMLRVNTTLNTLNLSNNEIGGYARDGNEIHTPNGPRTLFDCLKRNTTLTALDLSKNLVNADAVPSIASCIKINRTLKTINLRYNSIPEVSCQELRAAVGNKDLTLWLEPQ